MGRHCLCQGEFALMKSPLPAIAVHSLSKKYPKVEALHNVDLEISEGEFFGLLGPNGAGKSTLIHCLVGLCRPSSGQVLIFGKSTLQDYTYTKAQIGFSPQDTNVDRFFNLERTLQFQGGFFGLSRKESKLRAQDLLEQFDLADKAKEQFYKLSGGMQKRLLIARALMNKPKILILDEPTAGIDVEQRHELWQFLKDLHVSGTTILLTTHYIDEAEYLCERVGIINHGQIVEMGSPQALVEKYCEHRVEILLSEPINAQEFEDIPDVNINGSILQAKGQQLGPLTERILQRILQKSSRKVLDINIQKGDLEEVFVKTIGGYSQ